MKQRINERYDAELSTEKKKGHILFVSKTFHNKSTLYLVKPSLWTNASPYFSSILDTAEAIWTTHTRSLSNLIIPNNKRWFIGDSSQVFFNRALHFGIFSPCERRYPYVKGCNSGASQKISWEQVAMCLAHSTEQLIDWLMIAYIALFSALLSRLIALVCGSAWVTSFYSAFFNFLFWISTEVVYLQRWHGWCHMKLQPSRRKSCIHHTTMLHVTSCKATYVRCMRV